MEGENRKYQIGTKENKEFLEEIRKESPEVWATVSSARWQLLLSRR